MRAAARRFVGALTVACAVGATAGVPAAAAAYDPGTLVFYSAQGYDQAEATAFQQATGIRVELSDMSTGPLLARVQAESQNPRWDVIWFDGNAAMASLDKQGALLRNFTPPMTATYNALGRSLLPSDHAWFPTGTTAAGAIAYNTKLISGSQIPHNWTDLLKPEYRGAVGMNNPAISGPTYPLVAGLFQMMGESKGQHFFEKLKANGLHIFPTNGDTLQALVRGTIKVAMFQDSAQLGAISAGDPVAMVYPTQGVTMLPSDIAINAKAPDLKNAEAFVDFVLSQRGQQVMQDEKDAGSDSLFQPVTTAVAPLVKRHGVKWVVMNPVWAGAHEAAWTAWFTNNIVR